MFYLMKCHKFTINVASDTLSAIHGMASPQNRLYIPDKGVLGYDFFEKGKIDCFLENKNSINDAEKIIKGKSLGKHFGAPPDPKYLGEIDLEEDMINKFINSYKTKEKAEKDFQEKGRNLISLLK